MTDTTNRVTFKHTERGTVISVGNDSVSARDMERSSVWERTDGEMPAEPEEAVEVDETDAATEDEAADEAPAEEDLDELDNEVEDVEDADAEA